MVKIINRLGDVKIGRQGEAVYQRKYGEQIRRQVSPKRAMASEAQIAHRQLYRDALTWRSNLSLASRRYLDGYCIANGVVDSYHIPLPWNRFALKIYLQAVRFVAITKPSSTYLGEETKHESYEEPYNAFLSCYGIYINAQTFTPLVSHNITRVELNIYRLGNPTGIWKVSIRATDGIGHPTGTDLTYVEFPLPAYVPTGLTWLSFDLPSYPLSQNIKYAQILWSVGGNTSNCLKWAVDTTSPTYPRGCQEYSPNNGDSWMTYLGNDILFREFGKAICGEAADGLLHVRHPALLKITHKRGELNVNGYDTLSSLDEEYLTGQVGLDVQVGDTIEATTVAGIVYHYLVR